MNLAFVVPERNTSDVVEFYEEAVNWTLAWEKTRLFCTKLYRSLVGWSLVAHPTECKHPARDFFQSHCMN